MGQKPVCDEIYQNTSIKKKTYSIYKFSHLKLISSNEKYYPLDNTPTRSMLVDYQNF